jgi:hypothetical protein
MVLGICESTIKVLIVVLNVDCAIVPSKPIPAEELLKIKVIDVALSIVQGLKCRVGVEERQFAKQLPDDLDLLLRTSTLKQGFTKDQTCSRHSLTIKFIRSE